MKCNTYKIMHSSNRLKCLRILFIRRFIKFRSGKYNPYLGSVVKVTLGYILIMN